MRCAKASRHAGHGNEDLKGMMSACVVTRQADMLVMVVRTHIEKGWCLLALLQGNQTR